MRVTLIFTALMFCFSFAQSQNAKWRAYEIEADTLMAQEQYKSALALYTKSIAASELKDPNSHLLLYKRALCLFSLQQFKEAIADVEQLIKLEPDDDQAKLLKAYIGRDMQDTKLQLSALNDLLLVDPKNVDLLKWRASIFVDDGLYVEARHDIKAAKKITNDAELETYLGMSYYHQSERDSAIFYFDKAIALDETYITSYMYAASLCLEQDAYDLALTYLNQALKIDPANLTIQFYKGIALVEKKDLEAGCRCLRAAFKGGIDDAGDYLKDYCFTSDD